MDQSKANTEDMGLRATVLQLALQANAREGGEPYFIIEQAREFYLFLTGRDPVVDLGVPPDDDDPEDNVVLLSNYR